MYHICIVVRCMQIRHMVYDLCPLEKRPFNWEAEYLHLFWCWSLTWSWVLYLVLVLLLSPRSDLRTLKCYLSILRSYSRWVSNKFHMIHRAVAYALSVRTSPHIGPRRGFYLMCTYFESQFWLHLHCVFYLENPCKYTILGLLQSELITVAETNPVAGSITSLYLYSYTKGHRQLCWANYMNLLWCGGRVHFFSST